MKNRILGNFGKAAMAALAMTALVFAGCDQNVGGSGPRETGQVTFKFNIYGIPLVSGGQTSDSGNVNKLDVLRTVYPSGLNTAFTKYELSFDNTSGGAPHNPVEVTSGSATVTLVVGTYTITATAYTGSEGAYVAVAEGTVTGVVVGQSDNENVNITLGPKTDGANGTFSYDITIPSEADSATLTITTLDGTTVGTPVTLNTGQNSATPSLTPGYYWVLVSLVKGSGGSAEYAGLREVIHVYTGLTSALPAKTYAASDFAVIVAVSALDLSSLFDTPVAGAAPDTTLTGTQYSGTIAWAPAVTGNFATSTSYTATVTLTANPGYTFTGVTADSFTYTSATSVSNTVDSGVVTVVFPATGDASGQQSVSLALIDYTEIPVTGYSSGSGLTLTEGGATLTLSVTGYESVAWYVDGGATAASSTASITLDPANYSVKPHSLTVTAIKGGIPYARVLTFTVAAAGTDTPLPTPMHPTEVLAYVAGLPVGTPESPSVVPLSALASLTASMQTALKNGLAQNKYVVLDMSLVNLSAIYAGNNTSPTTSQFNYFGYENDYLVGIILPQKITKINTYSFAKMTGLRAMSIPAAVTSVENSAFSGCTNLTRVTFEGGSTTITSTSFPNSLKTLYDAQTDKAGTYVWNGTAWSKE